jgi:hypothetical protein
LKRASKHFSIDYYLLGVSFAIAFVLWMIAKERNIERVTVSPKVVIQGIPSNIEASSTLNRVQLSMDVRKSMLSQVQSDYFTTELKWELMFPDNDWVGLREKNLSPPHPLETSKDYFSRDISEKMKKRLARGVQQIVSVDPNTIRVQAQFITRPLDIELQSQGKLSEGFKLAEQPKLDNPEQTIYVTTSPKRFNELGLPEPDNSFQPPPVVVNIADRSETFFETIPLSDIKLPKGVSIAPGQKKNVDIKVLISEIVETRKIENATVSINPVNSGLVYSYEPKSATVTVTGPLRLVNTLKSTDILVVPQADPEESRIGETQDVPLKAIFSSSAPDEARALIELKNVQPTQAILNIQSRISADNGE